MYGFIIIYLFSQTYRNGCRVLDDVNLYNKFMSEVIKPTYHDSVRHLGFWNLLLQDSDQIGLISSSENPMSTVTESEAKNLFLVVTEDVGAATQTQEKSQEIDDVDFFADLA